VEDGSCLFCNDAESVVHLFFGCCVAREIWKEVLEIVSRVVGTDFESVAKWWLCDKKCKILNVVTSAILWSI
jgi:hypothetical protein